MGYSGGTRDSAIGAEAGKNDHTERMPGGSQPNQVRCCWCGRPQKEVGRLIASPLYGGPPSLEPSIGFPPGIPEVYICDGCVESLWEMLHDDVGE